MEDTSKQSRPGTLGVGERIRSVRRQLGLTQEKLAAPEFTKGYVSALERGAVRPSLKALDVLARRLGVSIIDLLSARQEVGVEPELRALEEDLHYQFNYARMLIRSNQVEDAFLLISEAEASAQPYKDKLAGKVLYRIPFLRGLAYLQLSDPKSAQPELEKALGLAENDVAVEAKVRNMLGVSYYLLEQPQLALEHHRKCLHAVETGKVKDLNLRLSIYRNVANNYWALNDFSQAIGIYQKALPLVDDLNDLEKQAGIFWGLAVTYKAAEDWPHAKLYATRALHIYEAADNRAIAATISLELAEISTIEGRYEDADRLLTHAKELLEGTGNQVLVSNLYYDYADLARRQGQLEKATMYITESLRVVEALVQAQQREAENSSKRPGEGNAQTQVNVMRTYADALHVAALIGEAQGHLEEADGFFKQALNWAAKTGFVETLYSINWSYAEVLKARGAFEEAVEYYRTAAHASARPLPTKLGN